MLLSNRKSTGLLKSALPLLRFDHRVRPAFFFLHADTKVKEIRVADELYLIVFAAIITFFTYCAKAIVEM